MLVESGQEEVFEKGVICVFTQSFAFLQTKTVLFVADYARQCPTKTGKFEYNAWRIHIPSEHRYFWKGWNACGSFQGGRGDGVYGAITE